MRIRHLQGHRGGPNDLAGCAVVFPLTGERESGVSPADTYIRGLELITHSISARTITNSSKEEWALPISLQRQRLVDFTILSKVQPHQGARSTLNIQLVPKLESYFLTLPSLKTVLRYFAVVLKAFIFIIV